MSRFDLGDFERRLHEAAFAFPETIEDHPWGEIAYKVRGKVFVFLHVRPTELSLRVKLPVSRDFAGMFDFAGPAGYGLGRTGWITCRLDETSKADPDLLGRGKLAGGGAKTACQGCAGSSLVHLIEL